jgi:hypothetical protein
VNNGSICPECGQPMHFASDCQNQDCTGYGCDICDVGCDWDFTDGGRCWAAGSA